MTTPSTSSSVSWQQPSLVNQPTTTVLPVNLQTPQHQHQQPPWHHQQQLPIFHHIHSPMVQTASANQPATRGTTQQMGQTLNTSGGSNGVPPPAIQQGINGHPSFERPSIHGPVPASAPPVTQHQQPVTYLPTMDPPQMPIVQLIAQPTVAQPPPLGVSMGQPPTPGVSMGPSPGMQPSLLQPMGIP